MSEFGAHFLLDTFFLSGDRTCGVSREGLCFLFFFFADNSLFMEFLCLIVYY